MSSVVKIAKIAHSASIVYQFFIFLFMKTLLFLKGGPAEVDHPAGANLFAAELNSCLSVLGVITFLFLKGGLCEADVDHPILEQIILSCHRAKQLFMCAGSCKPMEEGGTSTWAVFQTYSCS